MNKPFLNAFGASVYIVFIVVVINTITKFLVTGKESLIIPMTMLSLFVISAAVMGYLFLSEPLILFFENKKNEAIRFFAKTVGFFACFLFVFVILLFITKVIAF